MRTRAMGPRWRVQILCVLLVGVSSTFVLHGRNGHSLRAAPGPTRKELKKGGKEDYLEFAHRLNSLVHQISLRYFRPVSRAELLHAALSGLYRKAHRPIPRNLRKRIARAMPSLRTVRVSAVRIKGGISAKGGSDEAILELIREVAGHVGPAASREGTSLLLVCCQSMSSQLDPHSGLVTAEEQRRNVGLEVTEEGIGLRWKGNPLTSGGLRVESVEPGGPAQRMGIVPGDKIVKVNGKPAQERWARDRLKRIQSRATTSGPPPVDGEEKLPELLEVRLTLRRKARNKEWTALLRRERFRCETVLGVTRREDNRWNYWLDRKRGIVHVRLARLSRGTAEELRTVLDRLGNKVKGMLLDLRWCPGGFLDEAVGCADMFLGEGTIATIQVRTGENTVYRSTGEGPATTRKGPALPPVEDPAIAPVPKYLHFPMVVLINGQTSGGGELIAAALQDHRRCIVVGQRTRGKASVQVPLHLGVRGVGMKLTTGMFLRPGGKNLHRLPESKKSDPWGVRPQRAFPVSPDLSQALEKWWQQQTLRPGTSRQRLPLDTPGADPQAHFALRILRKMKRTPSSEDEKVTR